MAGEPTAEELDQWHRRFAMEANNRAWSLSEQHDLNADEKTELLHAATAAAYHWSRVGTADQIAHAELLLGRVYARLGQGELAMKHAQSAFAAIGRSTAQPWETAFAHAILADAAAAHGDAATHAEHYARAKRLGEALGADEKALFLATFSLIRPPVSGA